MLSRGFIRAARASSQISRIPARSPASSLLRTATPQLRTNISSPGISALPQSLSRSYSDAAQSKSAEEGAQAKNGEPAQTAEVETLKKDLEAKNKEVVDLKDKYLRSVADYRNLQDRTKREIQSSRDFALQKFAKDLLSSIDNLDHALRAVPQERVSTVPSEEAAKDVHKDLVSLHQGLQLIETVLLNTLQRHGVTRFDPAQEADAFDPNMHEAVFMAPQPDKKDNTVFHTQQKGFLLNGRVLRAAQVGVVKNS